nr:hypothetical protein [Lachnospiraceae bacterium]
DYIDSSGRKIFHIVYISMIDCIDSFAVLFREGFAPLILAAVFITILLGANSCLKRKGINKSIFYLLVVTLLFPFLISFPVELGYSGSGLPNRVLFLEHFVAVSIVLLYAFALGGLLSYVMTKRRLFIRRDIVVSIFAVSIAWFVFSFHNSVPDWRIVNENTSMELKKGIIQNFSNEVIELYT